MNNLNVILISLGKMLGGEKLLENNCKQLCYNRTIDKAKPLVKKEALFAGVN